MILRASEIAARLKQTASENSGDPLVITPFHIVADLEKSSDASVDLRLGTWFTTMRQNEVPLLEVEDEEKPARERKAFEEKSRQAGLNQTQVDMLKPFFEAKLPQPETRLVKMHHISFGSQFVLHPASFVLGVTLEWIRLPRNLAGYVVGRSGWGRRGLIIATAVGVHPSFTGCLTLELYNAGQVPISIRPGMPICQLFLHSTTPPQGEAKHVSRFSCTRRPVLGKIELDNTARKLARGCDTA